MSARKIAVLTSGGDAPGMNACIRAVVRTGIFNGFSVLGIERGYNGLISNNIYEMDLRSVGDIIGRGGTILHTARCMEFKTQEGIQKAMANIEKNQIDGIVVIGGDGSFRGAKELTDLGVPAIGIPGTIDNDLAYTDYSIGFDTAVNTALEAIRKIRDTMTSHDRVSVIEVMGNKCGDIALYAGLCGGAECIIVPEKDWSYEELCSSLMRSRSRGKLASIVVVAEGAGKGSEISTEIEKRTGMETRATVLGYIQRGGAPSARDAELASRFGFHAVGLLIKGIGGRVVGIHNEQIMDMEIHEAISMKKTINSTLYNIVNVLAI